MGVPIQTNSLISVNSQFRTGLKYLQTFLLPKRPFENHEGSRADVLIRAPDTGMWREDAMPQDQGPTSHMCPKVDSILDAVQERVVLRHQHF